jgi:catechol 2,3-dioxygenase-like lactoylglutathione lyase family enzyme
MLSHVTIGANDFERSFRFYSNRSRRSATASASSTQENWPDGSIRMAGGRSSS